MRVFPFSKICVQKCFWTKVWRTYGPVNGSDCVTSPRFLPYDKGRQSEISQIALSP